MSEIDHSKYYWKSDLIQLRRPKEEDWIECLPNLYDSEARVFFDDEIEMPVDADEVRQKHREAMEQKDYVIFVIENAAGEYVGVCNLFGVNERHGNFGPIGIQINPQFRGKGYGFAAMRMLGWYMFNERRMHKWNSAYVDGNVGSEALHRKLGFIIEGVQRDVIYHDGRYLNLIQCGMTEAEFFENEKGLPGLR